MHSHLLPFVEITGIPVWGTAGVLHCWVTGCEPFSHVCAHILEVDVEQGLEAWPLDLHHHLLSIDLGQMNLQGHAHTEPDAAHIAQKLVQGVRGTFLSKCYRFVINNK